MSHPLKAESEIYTFVDLVGEMLGEEFRAVPSLTISRDSHCSIDLASVSNWVSHRSEGDGAPVVFLGVPDSTVANLAGALGADSHPDPGHHAARTISKLLQGALTRVGRRLSEAMGAPTIDIYDGSGSPPVSTQALASYSITWEQETGTILLAADRKQVEAWEGRLRDGDKARRPERSNSQGAGNVLLSVEMPVTLSLGSTKVTLGDALDFSSGSIVRLGCAVDAPVDVIVGGKTVARGTVVAVEGMYGVRISEVLFEPLPS